MPKVFCPRHDEKTPSCEVYDEYAYCYGGCGRIPLSELGGSYIRPAAKPPTDLKSELERIKALPLTDVRGLRLPSDADGYYLLWPGDAYYKMRRWIGTNGDKYKNPRGHKKPLFIPHLRASDTLAIVEGELNALSLASVNPPFSVCSPGSASDFSEKLISQEASFFLTYKRFLVIVDNDKAGLEAAIRLKKALLKSTPYISIIPMRRDANELLVAGELSQEVERWLSQFGNVSTGVIRSGS